VSLNYAKITGYLDEDLYTIMIMYRRVVLRMRNVSNKICRENRSTCFIFNDHIPKIMLLMK